MYSFLAEKSGVITYEPIIKAINDELSVNPKQRYYFSYFFEYFHGILPFGAQFLLILSYANGKLNYFNLIGKAWNHVLLFFLPALLITVRFGISW